MSRRSFFICQHPMAQRRAYADIRVCRECLSVKTGPSAWEPARRWLNPTDRGIELLSEDGALLTHDWNHARSVG